MKRFAPNFLLSLLFALVLSPKAVAEQQYIDDTLLAPLRSGQGLEFRIVHKGLRSGTPVEILEQNRASGYSRIRTPQGIEGWLPTRFLTPQPIARDRLAKLTEEHNTLKSQYEALTSEHTSLSSTRQDLEGNLNQSEAALEQTQKELDDLRRVSQNALQLDSTNRTLRESNERLKNEVEVLTSENLRLKDKNSQDSMLLGGALVLVGFILALIIPMFKREKRSGW